MGRDGWGYRSDLGQARNEIFLQSHIDEALVCSRRRQPLILVALHGAARTARRVGRMEPTGRRKAPPDKLRDTIQTARATSRTGSLRRFRLRSLSYGGQVAPRNDVYNRLTTQ